MKKDIKSERTKSIFAHTAKLMIMDNGIESISVRKIAEQAGYVMGTLYNHFNNLDELLWMTRALMIQDIADHMNYDRNHLPESVDDIIEIFRKYAQYFIDNPSVYRFLYFKSLDLSHKSSESLAESQDFNLQLIHIWNNLIEQEILPADRAFNVTKIIIYSIHGLLTLTLGDNDQMHTDDIKEEIAVIIGQLLNTVN